MDTIYYLVKYKYFSDSWGMRSLKEDEVRFENLPSMYEYIAERLEENQITSIQQVIVKELDIGENFKVAKQSSSYKVELEGFENLDLIEYIESYKGLVKYIENVPNGFEIKKITDPYGNDLTCALLKKG